ncbi:unnamed protein product [Paramecium sonneborni]|uniref:Protein kinase domain-containing protein n=1 Tax=Paramecium sonneborni TaxID=65129 RepID=A0A8S1LNB8_9CILI|nr:unnamed protein product [Paramecium sonneborni]
MQQNQKISGIIDAPIINFPDRKFETIKELGQGTQGIVYLAKSINWGINDIRQFALKCQYFTKQEELEFIDNLIIYQKKFENPLMQQQNQQPSGLIKIFDRFLWNKQVILVMEIGELNLYEYINQQSSLKFEDKLKILIQISSSIQFIHKQKLLHRDIKPENFIKIGDEFKLIDYGLIKSDQNKFKTKFVGTILFLAPEIVENRSDYSLPADIWALGCVFYEVLTKQSLLNVQNQEQVKQMILGFKQNKDTLYNKINQLQENEMIKQLLKQMLEPNDQQRIQIQEVVDILKQMAQNQSNFPQQNVKQFQQPFQQTVNPQIFQQQKINPPLFNQIPSQPPQNLQETLSQKMIQSIEQKLTEIMSTNLIQQENNEKQVNIIQQQMNKMQFTIENQIPSQDLIRENSSLIKEQFAQIQQLLQEKIESQQNQIYKHIEQISKQHQETEYLQIKIKELNEIIQSQQQELDKVNQKEQQLKTQLESKQILDLKNQELERIVQKNCQQINNLELDLRNKQNKNIDLEGTIKQQQQYIYQIQEKGNEQQERLKQSYINLQNQEIQIKKYQTQVKQFEMDLKSYQDKNTALDETIKELDSQLLSKNRQIQDKKKMHEQIVLEYTNKLDEQENINQKQCLQINELKNQINMLQVTLNNQISKQQKEIQEKNSFFEKQTQEFQKEIKTNLEKQINQEKVLKLQINQQEEDIQNLKDKLEQQKQKYEEEYFKCKTELEQNKNQIERQKQEIREQCKIIKILEEKLQKIELPNIIKTQEPNLQNQPNQIRQRNETNNNTKTNLVACNSKANFSTQQIGSRDQQLTVTKISYLHQNSQNQNSTRNNKQ